MIGYRQTDRPRIEARSVKFAGAAMTLRDHRAAMHLDTRIKHGVLHAQPVCRNANELKSRIGNNWKAA